MTTSFLISLISVGSALILSTLIPFLSTLINAKFQLKLKRLEHAYSQEDTYNTNKMQVYSGFMETVGRFIHFSDKDALSNLGSYLYEMYLYLPVENWSMLDELIKTTTLESVDVELMISLCKIVSNELSYSSSNFERTHKRNKRNCSKNTTKTAKNC